MGLGFIIFDVIAIAILVLGFLIGLKIGFVKMFFKLMSFIIAVLVSFLFFSSFSGWFEKTAMGEGVRARVYNATESYLKSQIPENEPLNEKSFEGLMLPNFIKRSAIERINSTVTTITGDVANEFTSRITNSVTDLCMNVVVSTVFFICIWLALFSASFILERIFSIPILSGFNKLLGGIMGVANGGFMLLIICSIINMLPAATLSSIYPSITNSFVFSVFFENNLILKIIGVA